jgi:cell division protein FtsL
MIILILTFGCLLYVHLQIDLYKLSYEIKSNEKTVQMLVDQNRLLKYNVANLESPNSLERVMLAKNIELYYVDDVEILLMSSRTDE